MRYAIVSGSLVVNVVLWDGVSDWTPSDGCEAVSCGDTVGPGWTYDGVEFATPDAETE
jgi:hypothetical protein